MTTHALPPLPENMVLKKGAEFAPQLSPAAAWYFADEWVGVDTLRMPSLPFWLAAPEHYSGIKIQIDKSTLVFADATCRKYTLTAALPSNPTFINDATLQYFSQRLVSIRATIESSNESSKAPSETPIENGECNETLQLRTIWPQDWRLLDSETQTVAHWRNVIAVGTANASKKFTSYEIWKRQQAEMPRSFLGLILNGAQGDDDEAHGGHLALVFGDWQKNGDISQWWVANFYNPDVVSEKGILPAITTLDNYLCDLNCGQQQYRPSWLIGCALADELPVERIYASLHETMNALYSHAFVYQHTVNNCTGLTMDALRYAGLNVPMKGPSSRLLAPFLFLYKLVQERNWEAAKSAFQYFNAERTRLLPYVGFKHSIRHIMRILRGKMLPASELEASLLSNTCAVYGMHFPQIPSARPLGREPVSSVFQYQNRVPGKRENWKIIPVPPRPFPDHLRFTKS